MPILRTIQFIVLTLGLITGGLAQAEMTMEMSSANNPCAMKDGHNPCAMKHNNPCNPCSSKNPCDMKNHNPCNPCSMKDHNPCGMKEHNPCNPCAMKHKNPCGMKNPCAAKNPCAKASDAIDPNKVKRPAGTKLYSKASTAELVKLGEKLFNDNSLSSNGLSCATCHSTNDLFNESFATPYPHKVSMAKQRAGLNIIDADEFVQLCMLAPMESKTLAWESKQLAALTAYVKEVKQKDFMKAVQANPCHFKQKPAASNPCAGKNPCGMKHSNPCGMKNPCSKW
jgi:hypothetical protein